MNDSDDSDDEYGDSNDADHAVFDHPCPITTLTLHCVTRFRARRLHGTAGLSQQVHASQDSDRHRRDLDT